MRITSPDNPRVKDAVRLRDRRARTRAGRFLVEGRREVQRALEAGLMPESVFVEEARLADDDAAMDRIVAAAERAGGRIHPVNAAVSAKLALREGDEGVVAVFPIPDVRPEALRLPASPLVLAAEGLEKPGNVGALLRSADGLGADAFVTSGGTDLWNPNVVRSSLGCLFTVPVAVCPAGGLRSWLRGAGLRIVAATPDGERTPDEADLRGAVALVFGREDTGLPDDFLAAADERVRIPMRGSADSLNVSVSAGILLYEAGRQRARAAARAPRVSG